MTTKTIQLLNEWYAADNDLSNKFSEASKLLNSSKVPETNRCFSCQFCGENHGDTLSCVDMCDDMAFFLKEMDIKKP